MKTSKKIIAILLFFIIIISCIVLFTLKNNKTKNSAVAISSNIDGTISQILPVGYKVKKGEIIISIDDKDYKNLLNQKREELNKIQNNLKISNEEVLKTKAYLNKINNDSKIAKDTLEQANSDFVIYKNARLDGSITKKDLKAAQDNLEIARLQYSETQKNLEKINSKLKISLGKKNSIDSELKNLSDEIKEIELILSYSTIASPVDGKIVSKYFKDGDKVLKKQIILLIIPD